MTIFGIHRLEALQSKIVKSVSSGMARICFKHRPWAHGARDAGAFGRLTGGEAHRIAHYARLACFDAAPGSKMRVNGPVAQLDRATVS